MKKEILIIGSTSFIGVNLCLNLINCGYKIDGITSLQYKSKIKKKRIKELNKNKVKIYKKIY